MGAARRPDLSSTARAAERESSTELARRICPNFHNCGIVTSYAAGTMGVASYLRYFAAWLFTDFTVQTEEGGGNIGG